jgi:hypothetical protein
MYLPVRGGLGRWLGDDTDLGDDAQTSNIDPYATDDTDYDDGTGVIGAVSNPTVVTPDNANVPTSTATVAASTYYPGVAAGTTPGAPTTPASSSFLSQLGTGLTNLAKAFTTPTPTATAIAAPSSGSAIVPLVLVAGGVGLAVYLLRKRA